MTAFEDGPPLVASEASALGMTTVVRTGRRESGPVVPSPFSGWGRVRRAVDSVLVQPLKRRTPADRAIPVPRSWDDKSLRDIGINRLDIAAIGAFVVYNYALQQIALDDAAASDLVVQGERPRAYRT